MIITEYQFTPETPKEIDDAMLSISEQLPDGWRFVGFQLSKDEMATVILESGRTVSQWQINGSKIGEWSLGICDWMKPLS